MVVGGSGARAVVRTADTRRLAAALEPIAASVYFAREVHDAFLAVGFGPPTEAPGCLPLADLPAYYCSRAGCMGRVPGEVVVAAFGVFNPELVIPNVERGWATASLDVILRTRLEGQTAALQRVLGDQAGVGRATELLIRAGRAVDVGGRFLAAGLRSLPLPDEGWGRLWRAADIVREYRGDCHIAAWTSAGLDPVEAGLMTEIYHRMPSTTYHRGRGWRPAQLEAGLERLRSYGWITGDPPAFTEEGRAVREGIETATDRQQLPVLVALGDDLVELLALLRPWAVALVDAGCYPGDVRELPPRWGALSD